MRISISQDPFIHADDKRNWHQLGEWPCFWIGCARAGQPPFVTAFRRRFSVGQPALVRIHVAADERYDLYLDGNRIGCGNERGAPDAWFFETYDLPLSGGEHVLVARVWSLGERAAQAQMSVHPGFLLGAEGGWNETLGTGVAAWEAVLLPGYSFLSPGPAHWRGARVCVDGQQFMWGYQQGLGNGWQPVQVLKPGIGRLSDWEFHRQHLLRPAGLPPLINRRIQAGQARFVAEANADGTTAMPVRRHEHLVAEATQWNSLLNDEEPVRIPPHTSRRVLIDLEDYYCAYPEMVISGGAVGQVRLHWAESLYDSADPWRGSKGNRNEIEGKYFAGFGDTFLPDGGQQRSFDTLWWNAGRYIEVFVKTEDEAMQIEQLSLWETRYPLEMESQFHTSDPRLEGVMPLMVRVMQMCSNETFFDCPYYEELQYAGDSRLEALTTYVMTRDDRLPRKAIRMFDVSRLASGLTQSRYPSRVMQIIPPFALWWSMMVHDYAFWRNDLDFVRQLMPGLRSTVDAFQRFIGQDGLLYGAEGWNTMDWVPEWSDDSGVPPDGHQGASGLLNWQLVYARALLADLEERLNEHEMAVYFRARAVELAARALGAFWDEQRGLLADDLSHSHFSEHTQCMALLAQAVCDEVIPPAQRKRIGSGLLADPLLQRTTIYFSHYLFETYRILGRVDELLKRMNLWFQLVEQGLKTTIEMPEPTRSDCHAWGAHPLFHYFATILGIRPASLGFEQVEIHPQLGPLQFASGRLVHPSGGEIEMDLHLRNGSLTGRVRLPEGVTGWFTWQGKRIPLTPGENGIGE